MKQRAKFPEQLLVFTGALIFFLCTLAANFSGPHDSIGYLNGVLRGGIYLSHPHHLLYHYTAYYWLHFMQALLPGVKDYYLLETLTAICGSGSVAVIYSFFRYRFQLPGWQSLVSTTVITFSYGMWFYSVNIEVYAPPMFLLLTCLYVLTRPGFSKKDLLLAAVLHSLAILFHQVHILFTPVILLVIWKNRVQLNVIKSVIQYALIGVVLVGGVYFLMGWVVAGNHSVPALLTWMESYARAGIYWKPISIQTPMNVFFGVSHAFLGGHYIFKFPGMSSSIDHSLAVHSLHDEIFLGQHITGTTAVILTILTIALAIFVLLLTIRFFRHFRTIRSRYKTFTDPMLIAIFIYAAFFCVWMPEILEFWIFQMVLFWILILGTIPVTGFPLRIKPVTGVAFLSVSMLLINYFGSIEWLQDLDHDLYYKKVEPVKDLVTNKDVAILQEKWILEDFLHYFTKADVHEVPYADSLKPAVDKAINDCIQRGGKIYVYPEVGAMSISDTSYIDSVLHQFPNKQTIIRAADPRIIVIDPLKQ